MISIETSVSESTIWRWQARILKTGSIAPSALVPMGRPQSLTQADEQAMLEWMLREGWMMLDQIQAWLWYEQGVMMSTSTICCTLKRNGWTRKEMRRVSLTRSDELRCLYLRDMSSFVAEDLVFLDKSIFNEKTGWRHQAYAPIGSDLRYHEDVQRGKT
jgi:transposase